MNRLALESEGSSIRINIPMALKKRAGRKEVVIPQGLDVESSSPSDYHRAFVIALARAHRWQALLDRGEYASTSELAKALGICNAYVSRIMRLSLLAPDIIEAILDGAEPEGFSLNRFVGQIPTLWTEQRKLYGFPEPVRRSTRTVFTSYSS